MRNWLILFSLLFVCVNTHAETMNVDRRVAYDGVDLVSFVQKNQVTEAMAKKKQRLMLKPKPISFEAFLMQVPKPGQFSLPYDALNVWQGEQAVQFDLDIGFSAFVGFEKGPVLGTYVTRNAAEMLKNVSVDKPAVFYALHIYNYSGGPRLVIVAAEQ